MNSSLEKNKGFTLIELIISIAMLAFLMTAVTAFMTSGVASYKKAKADTRVSNSAQENYDVISEAIMEAKDVYLFGYPKVGGTISTDLYCYVRDESQAGTGGANITKVASEVGGIDISGGITTRYFSSLKNTDEIYIKALVVDTSVDIENISLLSDSYAKATTAGSYYYNFLTGEDEEITVANKTVETVSGAGTTYTPALLNGTKPIYTVNDTCRKMFLFDENKMYYMKKYAFMTYKNDNYVDGSQTNKNWNDYLYSISFDEEGDYTTAIANVDADSNSMSVDLIYSDKDMTYTTDGMIKTRNTYVLKPKK